MRVKRRSVLYSLPWLQRTSERAHRTADRGRATAGRRASCPSVAVQSPNYARTKTQSVTLVAIAKLNLCLPEAENIFRVHSSPCTKLSELESGLLTYYTRLQGFVWQTVCVDTLLILAVRGNPPVSLTFSTPSVSLLPFLPLFSSTSFLHTSSLHTWFLPCRSLIGCRLLSGR